MIFYFLLTDPMLEPTVPPKPDDGNFNFVAIDFVFGAIGGFALIITIGVVIMLKRQRKMHCCKINEE